MNFNRDATANRMAVLNLMIEAADAGAPPPEYRTIADKLGISIPYANKIVLWLVENDVLRRPDKGLFQFEIVGTGKVTAPGKRIGVAGDGLRDRERELIDYLRGFIGRPIPKNPELAQAIRGLHPASISSVLCSLEAAGKIMIRRDGIFRVLVSIQRQPEAPQDALRDDTLRHVDNRVCGYCGTRAAVHDQFGCRRSIAA
ncbi:MULTISPECIES: hypothetical protein [unclassified Novosphingobium]|uniref:hypothetical protein n=1 Tax=unclassified Novosphingobium TaxID=2644732 RepID=UPI000D31D9B7|nr:MULTISPECIES: hypothetical protein [unclassified Novosphingobium]PTR06412.1 hypothetical protein C8K11_12025 [Novosphingobium sp. GV055]PUA94831.1 hypothetical protein C8K12_12025 [Novosphingobium sp. GV061]PUB13756.1 hypothetical protein C8K14_12025 [Novosphingobium sp. GV079]PUB38454.1 hypothetical protein C8K10_12025 [Novosphingobium sp. GV027]